MRGLALARRPTMDLKKLVEDELDSVRMRNVTQVFSLPGHSSREIEKS